MSTLSPGAHKSTVVPAVAQQLKLSPGPMAETETTLFKPAGAKKSKFVPLFPPFPALATTIEP